MNINRAFGAMLVFVILSCGADETGKIIVSGNVIPGDNTGKIEGPLVVTFAEGRNIDEIRSDPVNSVVWMSGVDKKSLAFNADLTQSGASSGDEVLIFAFIDNDFSGGIPYPTPGDYVGFYIDEDLMSPVYVLKEGRSTGVNININREVFDFNASVTGRVNGNDEGTLTLAAYAGEINSFDTADIDFDKIIGFYRGDKGSAPFDYNLNIMPYGFNVPIYGVYLIAILDVNRNGLTDAGDKIGFHTGASGMPQTITVNEGITANIDLDFIAEIAAPSGDAVSVSGEIFIDPSISRHDEPLFIIVAEASSPDSLEAMMAGDLSALRYFGKLPDGENKFRFDLSKSGLGAGDGVMIIALLDMNNTGGFPDPDEGDYIGYYMNETAMSPVYILSSGDNKGININLNREVFGFSAKVSGTVNGTDEGLLTIAAYAGEINSFDLSDIDFDKIIGFKETIKSAEPLSYELNILPYGFDVPINNVYIIGLLDVNENGVSDAGDKIGFYTGGGTFPRLITIDSGVTSGIDIDFIMELEEPSPDVISMDGNFSLPEGYTSGDTPVFVMVAKIDSPDDLNAILEGDISAIKYFEKLGQGEYFFDFDLSGTSLSAGDNVMVLAFWDRDYAGGFPDITPGDLVGFYQNPLTYSTAVSLNAGRNVISPVNGWTFDINRKIYSHNASLSFRISQGDISLSTGDRIIVIAVQKQGVNEGADFGLTQTTLDSLDMDYVIGMSVFDKNADGNYYYSLDILPAIYTQIEADGNLHPAAGAGEAFIDEIYVFAVLDSNLNGVPDEGESVGFYSRVIFLTLRAPKVLTVVNNGVNILDDTVRFSNETF